MRSQRHRGTSGAAAYIHWKKKKTTLLQGSYAIIKKNSSRSATVRDSFLGSMRLIAGVLSTHLVQWLCWVFTTQERKKARKKEAPWCLTQARGGGPLHRALNSLVLGSLDCLGLLARGCMPAHKHCGVLLTTKRVGHKLGRQRPGTFSWNPHN